VSAQTGRVFSACCPLVSSESFETFRAAQLQAVELIEGMRTAP
jgi:hypothetical protein